MATRPTTSEFNPLYEETFDNSHQVYEDMRNRCPVAHSEEFGGFWALFKYEDIVRIQEDSETFSVSPYNVVPRSTRKGLRRPPFQYDPPEHEVFRKPINVVFRKSRMSELEEPLVAIANQMLDPLVQKGQFNFTQDFAEYFTAAAFGLVLQLPLPMMMRAREAGVRYYRAQIAMDRPRIELASEDLYTVAREAVESRQNDLRAPEEDLISSLLMAKLDDKPMPVELVVACIRQFLAAAQAAPQAVLGSMVVHLSRDVALQAKLRDRPDLIPTAVEEFLRMYAPYRVFARTATRDVEVGGRQVLAGEPLVMVFPSGNRDAEVFERPHEFDLERKQNRHIAFGRGAHACPAAPLGRLELIVGIRTLLSKTSSFAMAGPVKMTDWLEFGPSSTPLTVTSASAAVSAN